MRRRQHGSPSGPIQKSVRQFARRVVGQAFAKGLETRMRFGKKRSVRESQIPERVAGAMQLDLVIVAPDPEAQTSLVQGVPPLAAKQRELSKGNGLTPSKFQTEVFAQHIRAKAVMQGSLLERNGQNSGGESAELAVGVEFEQRVRRLGRARKKRFCQYPTATTRDVDVAN